MSNIKFTIKEDFRCFKKGDVYEWNIPENGVMYLVGSNGSGKSTLLRTLRVKLDSLKDINKESYDGMESFTLIDSRLDSINVDVEGFDYDEAFFLDAVTDDPQSMENSATAVAAVLGGGAQCGHISKGEKSNIMMGKFMKQIEDYLTKKYGSVDEFKKSGKRAFAAIDEVDEGLDLKKQSIHTAILRIALIDKFGIESVICVSHNPLCMMSKSYTKFDTDIESTKPTLYDMDTKEKWMPDVYFTYMTGFIMESIDEKINNKNNK